MPTPKEMIAIIGSLYEPPTWLWPGERILFAEANIAHPTEASADEWRFVGILVNAEAETLKMAVMGVPGQILRVLPTQVTPLISYVRGCIRDILTDLRPTRDYPPHVGQILDLAIKARFGDLDEETDCDRDKHKGDDAAFLPLGDLILETQWFDRRVIDWLWEKGADAIDQRDLHFHLAADCKQPGKPDGPWAKMKREWAGSIAAHIMFGEWAVKPKHWGRGTTRPVWDVVARQWTDDPFTWRAGSYGEDRAPAQGVPQGTYANYAVDENGNPASSLRFEGPGEVVNFDIGMVIRGDED